MILCQSKRSSKGSFEWGRFGGGLGLLNYGVKGVLGGYKWSVMLNIIRNLFSLSNMGLFRVRWRVFFGFVEGW